MTDDQLFALDLARPREQKDVLATIVEVARRTGRGPFGQAFDLLRLKSGPGKIDIDEYYAFGLYDRGRFSPAEAARFAGRRRQAMDAAVVNDPSWYALGQDKLAAGAVLTGLGLPVPRIHAIVHRDRGGPDLPALRDRPSLARFLRDGMSYPFFGKPIGGSYSLGVLGVESHDRVSDTLRLSNGRRVGIDAYVEALFSAYEAGSRYHLDGFMFQELLRPHPAVAAISGSATLSTLRVVLLVDDGQASLFRAAWKIPAGANQADNFWRAGNLLAPIDVATGHVGEAVRGKGLDQERMSHHPDTGAAIAGVVLPDWAELAYLGREATSAFPGMQMQGWDIALTDQGPRLIEVNGVGDYDLPQIAYGRGLLERDFLAFLDRCRARKSRKPAPPPVVGAVRTDP